MEQRPLGRSGVMAGVVGLGTEYLINLPEDHVTGVIREALDRGVNYFDLFYAQPDLRDVMGRAFTGRRQSALLAAHLGAGHKDGQYARTRDLAEAEALIADFLRRYHTDYVDVLYVHNSDDQEDYDFVMGSGGFLEAARRFREQGKARLIGFSGHIVSTSLQAVESGEIDVLMFPVNIAGHAVEGRRRLLEACRAHGVGVVAMKPYAGGRLLRPDSVLDLEPHLLGADGGTLHVERPAPPTPVQCLAYVLSLPAVSTMVPGCRSVAELSAALAVLEATAAERDFSGLMEVLALYTEGECVYCNHCLPCPSGIDIGRTLRLADETEGRPTAAQRAAYAALPATAEECIQCGLCTERCPFGVATEARIEQAAALFAG